MKFSFLLSSFKLICKKENQPKIETKEKCFKQIFNFKWLINKIIKFVIYHLYFFISAITTLLYYNQVVIDYLEK